MNLRDFASALTRSWLVIATATVAGLVSGWAVGNVARTVYSTTSRVVVMAAPAVGTPEDAQRVTSMIRSEMSLYQVLAQGNHLTERVATRATGITAEQVADATTVVVSDQLLSLTVTLPDQEQSVKVAKVFADEMVAEIRGLHPSDPQLLRAEAVEAPVRTITTIVGRWWGSGNRLGFDHRLGTGRTATSGGIRWRPGRRWAIGASRQCGHEGLPTAGRSALPTPEGLEDRGSGPGGDRGKSESGAVVPRTWRTTRGRNHRGDGRSQRSRSRGASRRVRRRDHIAVDG